jgi:hypothetical protein
MLAGSFASMAEEVNFRRAGHYGRRTITQAFRRASRETQTRRSTIWRSRPQTKLAGKFTGK